MIAEASTDILIAQPTIMGGVEIVVISSGLTAWLPVYRLGEGKAYDMPLRENVINIGSI